MTPQSHQSSESHESHESAPRQNDAATLDAGQHEANAEAEAESARDGQADFDFLIGSWTVHNRRLRQPLRGSTEWYEFEGTNVARRVWDGSANMDEYDAVTPQGRIQGMTIRIYQHDTRQWRIYWANRANGVIDPPMQGTFTQDGRGEFYSHEQFNGQGILVRFLWTVISPEACRWEQAFSADGGRSWETNWIMNMTRVGASASTSPSSSSSSSDSSASSSSALVSASADDH